jgi:putative transposase
MEEQMIAQEFIDSGYPINKVLKYLNLSRSSYYYRPKESTKKRGVSISQMTRKQEGGWVTNKEVVKDIENILSQEFVDYGYVKVTHWLQQEKQYIINKKKVYRLMQSEGLLNKPVKTRQQGQKEWIKEFVPKPSNSLEYFEMDIKYMPIIGQKRNALLLSVIDVESRWVLSHKLAWQIKQKDVTDFFDKIFMQYSLPKNIYIRNDNGTQFAAEIVQNYFKTKGIKQEFTIPATPEQNAHIESYHSILNKIICNGYQFETIQEARKTLDRWLVFYNRERIHSGIDYLSPYKHLIVKGIDIDQIITKAAA